jgi:hypothetical protein
LARQKVGADFQIRVCGGPHGDDLLVHRLGELRGLADKLLVGAGPLGSARGVGPQLGEVVLRGERRSLLQEALRLADELASPSEVLFVLGQPIAADLEHGLLGPALDFVGHRHLRTRRVASASAVALTFNILKLASAPRSSVRAATARNDPLISLRVSCW